MVKNNVRKIIVCLISVVMVLAVAKTCLATGSTTVDDLLKATGNVNSVDNTNAEPIKEGENQNKLENSNSNLSTNTNTNTNTNANANKAPTTTPYTGIGDYSSIIFIGIFAVSALYAYKKIREYNA